MIIDILFFLFLLITLTQSESITDFTLVAQALWSYVVAAVKQLWTVISGHSVESQC